MSKFIYFTPEEKARAQNTDLVSLLRAQGERPVRSGREFRTPNDPSITVRGNKWFDHSARVGGYAVSFVQRYYRLPYQEAVLLLLGRKYSLQGTTQGRYLTGGVPPVRFSM